jgi:hypothetical protein
MPNKNGAGKTKEPMKIKQLVEYHMEQDAGIFFEWREWEGRMALQIGLLYNPDAPVESTLDSIADDFKGLGDLVVRWLREVISEPDRRYFVVRGNGQRRKELDKADGGGEGWRISVL